MKTTPKSTGVVRVHHKHQMRLLTGDAIYPYNGALRVNVLLKRWSKKMTTNLPYSAEVVLGTYKFMNVREAHAYALSLAKDNYDYTKIYLTVAGPQIILNYREYYTKLVLVYFTEHYTINDYYPYINRTELPIVINRRWFELNSIKEFANKLGVLKCYNCKGYTLDMIRIVNNSYHTADNNRFVKELFRTVDVNEIIEVDMSVVPMSWRVKSWNHVADINIEQVLIALTNVITST